jgi:tRNA(Ile)-lysidine synthase
MTIPLPLLPEGPLLLGISGGGDSMALLHLLLEHSESHRLTIATFNHNWSSFGPQSTAFVQAFCESHNLPFLTATGSGKPATNAESFARTERHQWLQQQAQTLGATIVLAHTQTDVAEGFLMRAGKGSGVGGLAALQPLSCMNGIAYARPLLGASRQQLRNYLTSHGHTWLEDPDNASGGSQRARIRKLLPLLEEAGITTHGLFASATAAFDADAALHHNLLKLHLTNPLPLDLFRTQPTEIALRLLLKIIQNINPNQQLPVRRSKRQNLLTRLQTEPQGHATLSGVKFSWKNGQLLTAAE